MTGKTFENSLGLLESSKTSVVWSSVFLGIAEALVDDIAPVESVAD